MLKKIYFFICKVFLIGILTFLTAININCAESDKSTTSENIDFSRVEAIAAHLKNKEYALAISGAKRHLSQYPEDVLALNILAEACIATDDLTAARQAVQGALAVQPNDLWAHRLSARIYKIEADKESNNEKLDLALREINKGLAIDANDYKLLSEAAMIYFQIGDMSKAKEAINKALNIKPDDDFLKSLKEDVLRKK